MYYDDYSTSFQSLYKPMYNVQANYNANMNGAMGAGMGAGYNGMSGMGYMSPMTNIGVGQFGADQLVKGDEARNNYYARPIAIHKKKDDIPAMLGILGTALGTTALLIALSKGKFKGRPRSTSPVTVPPVTVPPVTVPNLSVTGNLSTVPPKYLNPNTAAYNPLNNMTSKQGILNGLSNPAAPVNFGGGSQIIGVLPQYTSRKAAAIAKQQAAMNLPSSGIVYAPEYKIASGSATAQGKMTSEAQEAYNRILGMQFKPGLKKDAARKDAAFAFSQLNPNNDILPIPFKGEKITLKPIQDYLPKNDLFVPHLPNKTQLALSQAPVTIKGALPAPGMSEKYQQALLKQQAAMNLPSSGVTHTSATPELRKVNDNLLAHNPELLRNGSIVHTTHTPESIAQGYSIGSNAKGADKLAALLAQLQG